MKHRPAPKQTEKPASQAKKWNGGKWIRPERRLAIYLRDQFECAYCGRDLRQQPPENVTLDHLDARSNGGDNATSNLVTACKSCNSARRDRPWREYATGGAVERIERLVASPVNLALAKSILSGTSPNLALEQPRPEADRQERAA